MTLGPLVSNMLADALLNVLQVMLVDYMRC